MAISQKKYICLMFCGLLTPLPLCAGVLFDPTRPSTIPEMISPGQIGVAHRSWSLQSTLVAPGRRVAVINGKLVSEGESVDGARVIKIRQHNVLVQTPSKQMTLQLLSDIVKIKR